MRRMRLQTLAIVAVEFLWQNKILFPVGVVVSRG